MSQRVALAALLSLVAVTAALPARAEIDASGTRLSIAGSPARFYMTYGHPADPELYAPIMGQLRRAGVSFERNGDEYIVYVRGVKKASWPIVESRDSIPESGEPIILVLGGNVYVPVRATAELGKLQIGWDRRNNVVAVNPTPTADNRTVTPAVQPRLDALRIKLSGVEVEQKGATLQVHIKTSGPIKPRLLKVGSDNNPRLCLDFANARWNDNVILPAGMGDLKALRTGHPDGGRTARLTCEVPGLDFNITNVRVERDEVLATISRGIQARNVVVAPDAQADVNTREGLLARANTRVASALADRQLDGNFRIGDGSSLPIVPRPAEPEIGTPSRFTPAGSLQGRTIVVDAGHGGHHAGASGLNYLEKELCLKMAFELERALEQRGARVIMTRTSDLFVSLDERCQIANQSGADIFISIHCNSMLKRNTQSGSESYWHSSEQSRRLARALHPRLVASVQGRDGGIRNRSFQVIRETRMPSVLLEIAYINNTKDEILLADGDFHKRLAENLAQGVLDYFGTDR